MKLCATCGIADDSNKVHASNYTGIGKHSFKTPAAKSLAFATEGLEDIRVYAGGAIKAVGDTSKGGFEGYLVRFSSAEDPDLVGDFFTKGTNFYVEDEFMLPVMYDHGLNSTLKGRKIGRAKVSFDDVGLFIKGELDLRDEYEKAIYDQLIVAGKAGLSSGAARHMTAKSEVRKGISEILSWGVAEASITPAPTEPRCGVQSLKSYFTTRVDPLDDEGETETKTIKKEKVGGEEKFVLYTKDGAKKLGTHDSMDDAKAQESAINAKKKSLTKGNGDEEDDLADGVLGIKGLFASKLAEKTPSIWEIRNVLDEVLRDIACACMIDDITGQSIDINAKVTEAVTECAQLEIPLIVAQIRDWVEKGGDRESNHFYLRSIQTKALEGIGADLGSGSNLNEHSTKMVTVLEEYTKLSASVDSAVKAWTKRCEDKIEFRRNDPLAKSGRVLSKENLAKLADINEVLGPLSEALSNSKNKVTALLQLGAPEKSLDDTVLLELQAIITRNQNQNVLLGIPQGA